MFQYHSNSETCGQASRDGENKGSLSPEPNKDNACSAESKTSQLF
jgi:hypothetical protein